MAQRKDLGEVKLAEIIPYENNPRKNEPAVKAVMNSISEFDFLNPIIVDENMVILAGHTRLIASQRLGLLTAPCIMATGLSEDQKKAYRLVDNKSSELAEWDLEKLTQELSEIDLDMSDFGFDDISEEDFGEDFELKSGEQDEFRTMTFTLHEKQKTLIEHALDLVADEINETFGNQNSNGNALYEVCKQWEKQKK